ncbi:hypothetical protein [Streptomyces pactum]|nr:hypothetical protein [Streptomyces pactum]
MEQIQDVGHYVAMNKSLFQEWQKHRSKFSLQWLSYMQRRGKVRFVECHDEKVKILAECIEVTESITLKQKDAVRKDFLLVQCAWASDELISSLDEKMRSLLSVLSSECAEIGSVVWVNPAREEDGAVEWARAGARVEEHRKLRNWGAA